MFSFSIINVQTFPRELDTQLHSFSKAILRGLLIKRKDERDVLSDTLSSATIKLLISFNFYDEPAGSLEAFLESCNPCCGREYKVKFKKSLFNLQTWCR